MAAEAEQGGERTEEPSPKRLQDARERGQVPRSRELTNFATMIGGSAMLAAIGGLMVPSFAMPDSFKTIMKISPLHWCLEAYYGLFLEGGKLGDVLTKLIPLLIIIAVLQFITFLGLKRKNLI